MTITTYCTADSVRAVLGVSDEEIPDTVILDPIYSLALDERLIDIDSGLAPFYATLPTTGGTQAQVRFLNLVNTYSAYIVAQQLLNSVKMFAPQIITDSKSTMTRNIDAYADLRTNVIGSINYLYTRITSAYTLLNPSGSTPQVTPRIFAVSVGGYDPVTDV